VLEFTSTKTQIIPFSRWPGKKKQNFSRFLRKYGQSGVNFTAVLAVSYPAWQFSRFMLSNRRYDTLFNALKTA